MQKVSQKLTAQIGKEKFFSLVAIRKEAAILHRKISVLSKLLNGKSVLGKNCFPMYFIHFSTSTKIFKKS